MNLIEVMEILNENPTLTKFAFKSSSADSIPMFIFKGPIAPWRPMYESVSRLKGLLVDRKDNFGSVFHFDFADFRDDWMIYDREQVEGLIKSQIILEELASIAQRQSSSFTRRMSGVRIPLLAPWKKKRNLRTIWKVRALLN